MFDKTILILSLLLPVPCGVAVFLADCVLQTGLFEMLLILVYLEHVLIGYLVGFDLGRDAYKGEWIGIPLNTTVFTATFMLDYLLVALIVYVALTLLKKTPELR